MSFYYLVDQQGLPSILSFASFMPPKLAPDIFYLHPELQLPFIQNHILPF